MACNARLGVLRKHFCSASKGVSAYKAAECQQLKQPLVLLSKTSRPLEDHEVRIRNRACGLNFATYLTTRGEYQVKLEPPFVPGTEVAGEVLEVGKDVASLSPGDVVIGLLETGGLQEVVTVPGFMLDIGALTKVELKAKRDVDYCKLASLIVNYGTAWMALTRKGLIKEGETVLVTGASGGVGLAAVELAARIFNCQVIAVCRDEKSKMVKQYGAHNTIDYTRQNIRKELKELAPSGVNIVFDAVGGDGAVDLVKSLAIEGRFITIGYTAGIPKIPANILLLKSASAVGLWWGNTMQTVPDAFRESVETVTKMYLDGKINPYIQQSFPLEKVNEAFGLISSRKVVGKLVIEM
ncbi:quinone oxidoreductase-like protein 2 homolog [Watersipora subatra]|uniref:quinone oxidoreductase-like protein 2 homolog n=1 Tax=Watersipora subatra TaxID=2589382 RepID=UPI00355B4422